MVVEQLFALILVFWDLVAVVICLINAFLLLMLINLNVSGPFGFTKSLTAHTVGRGSYSPLVFLSHVGHKFRLEEDKFLVDELKRGG